jgi:hypothetical protein
MLITALGITAAIVLAVAWLTIRSWPEWWALAWAISMVGMTACSWMAQMWMYRAFAWESAYWRDTKELQTQLTQARQQLRSQLQGSHDAESQRANLGFVCDDVRFVPQRACIQWILPVRSGDHRKSFAENVRANAAELPVGSYDSVPTSEASDRVVRLARSIPAHREELFPPPNRSYPEIVIGEYELPYRSWPNTV